MGLGNVVYGDDEDDDDDDSGLVWPEHTLRAMVLVLPGPGPWKAMWWPSMIQDQGGGSHPSPTALVSCWWAIPVPHQGCGGRVVFEGWVLVVVWFGV